MPLSSVMISKEEQLPTASIGMAHGVVRLYLLECCGVLLLPSLGEQPGLALHLITQLCWMLPAVPGFLPHLLCGVYVNCLSSPIHVSGEDACRLLTHDCAG